MSFSDIFIRRPVLTSVLGAMILLLGFQGIFNLFRVASLRRNAETCIDCKACDKACPMNIEVSKLSVVRNHQCISCMECTSSAHCPVPATVDFVIGGKK